LIRHVEWRLDAANDSAEAASYAALMDGMLFQDLDVSWSMLLSEILSFLPYGWSYHEMVFKRRQGPTPPPFPDGTPQAPSHYADGYIGFATIAPRSQDSLLRWAFAPNGDLLGMHQLDPWMGRQAYLPAEKCLLFRATSFKRSPEGKSILRNAYRSWWLCKHIENTEGIGIERDLCGVPLITVPPQWMSASASAEDVARLEMVKRIGRSVRQDEQTCIVLPGIYDDQGNQLLKFELLSTAGRRQFDTRAVIERYELRIAQSTLADMIFLGHEAVGSFALASSKTTTLAMALGGFLGAICDVFNREAIPLIWRLNAFPPALRPTLCHGDIESVDMKDLAQFISAYSQIPAFDLADVENHVRTLAGFPERQAPANDMDSAS